LTRFGGLKGNEHGAYIFAAEAQRQRKRMENRLKRSAQQLGYQLIPLGQTA